MINTDILSLTVSKLSHIIVEILDTAFLFFLGTTYAVHLRLIEKLVVDFLFVLIELFFARCYE